MLDRASGYGDLVGGYLHHKLGLIVSQIPGEHGTQSIVIHYSPWSSLLDASKTSAVYEQQLIYFDLQTPDSIVYVAQW